MSDFILIEIKSEARVHYSKRVNMKREDYEKYQAIWREYPGDIDEQIAEIAMKYGFDEDDDNIDYIDSLEEIEFEPIIQRETRRI